MAVRNRQKLLCIPAVLPGRGNYPPSCEVCGFLDTIKVTSKSVFVSNYNDDDDDDDDKCSSVAEGTISGVPSDTVYIIN